MNENSKISHCSLDVNEEHLDLGKSAVATKLGLIKSLINLVDRPLSQLSFEETIELLLELALNLQYFEEQLYRNDEVYEDPLNRGDDLGNVRMIHQKIRVQDTQVLRDLGFSLQFLAHRAMEDHQRKENSYLKWQEALYHLILIDDLESEDILAAKQRIALLRKENQKLEHRNLQLYGRICELRDQKDKYHLIAKVFGSALRFEENRYQAFPGASPAVWDSMMKTSTDICTVGENGRHKEHPRKMSKAKNHKSQMDCLRW